MEQFAYLLDSGLDIRTIITLTFHDHEKILSELEKGKPLYIVLTQYENSLFFSYVALCAAHISLPKAIDCAKRMDAAHSGLATKLLKRISYPIFLFVFAYILVQLFSNTIIPSMAVYAPDNNLSTALHLLKISYTFIFILMIYVFAVYLLKNRSHIYRRYMQRINWIKKRNTYEFSILWQAMIEAGMSSYECFEAISKLKGNENVRQMAIGTCASLMQGKTLHQVFSNTKHFDTLFMQYVEIGMRSSDICQLLTLYQQKSEKDLEQMLQKAGNQIQLFAYMSVGILVFIFYQVMLYPLNMLTTF